MPIPAASAAVVSLALIVVSTSACSSGSKSTSSSGTSNSSVSTAQPAAKSSSSGSSGTTTGSAKTIDVCTALPASAVSQITGTTFTSVKASNTEGVIFECDYSNANSDLLLISVTTQGGKIGFSADVSSLKTVGHAPSTVSGVGDEAFSAPDPKGNAGSVGASSFASYGAVFGDTYVKVGGFYVTAAQGKQIAEELHSKV